MTCTDNCSGITVKAEEEPTGAVTYEAPTADNCAEVPLVGIRFLGSSNGVGEVAMHICDVQTFGNTLETAPQLFINGEPCLFDCDTKINSTDSLTQDYTK